MRVINPRRFQPDRHVSSEEEAYLALAEMIDSDICAAATDCALRDYHNGLPGAQRRTVGDAVDETLFLRDAVAAYRRWTRDGRERLDRPELAWCTVSNPLDWPQGPAALRQDPALAFASVAELAARANCRLREEAASVLTACADYHADDSDRTVSADVCELDDFEVSFGDFIGALTSGGHCWRPLCDWTPAGGAFGDPFTVCRYAWGPLRVAVKLEPAELLRNHLAGNADLSLNRTLLSDGSACLEVIWPHQRFSCCGHEWVPDPWLPFWVERRNRYRWRREPALRSRDAQCKLCGTVGEFFWLTCRTVEGGASPLGDIESIDGVSEAALGGAPEAFHAGASAPRADAEPERRDRWN